MESRGYFKICAVVPYCGFYLSPQLVNPTELVFSRIKNLQYCVQNNWMEIMNRKPKNDQLSFSELF
jgi:hypothetical protein